MSSGDPAHDSLGLYERVSRTRKAGPGCLRVAVARGWSPVLTADSALPCVAYCGPVHKKGGQPRTAHRTL